MKMQIKQERPIIFSGEMVRAILDGKKTMTRRVVNDFYVHDLEIASGFVEGSTKKSNIGKFCFANQYPNSGALRDAEYVKCSYGKVGDRLWVRETWIQGYDDPLIESEGDDKNAVSIIYKADGKEEYRSCSAETAENWGDFSADNEMVGFKSPIHMPRWASRILLEITDIRVERLQDISEVDAVKEGVKSWQVNCSHNGLKTVYKDYSDIHNDVITYNNPIASFKTLWDTLNAKKDYPFSRNPWVWVVEFKVVEGVL